jgi:hypothetical protein
MSRPKTLYVGAGVLARHRNGACAFTCRHDGCHAYSEPRGWRAGVRLARQHDADHTATEARNVGTPWGLPAHELPPTRRAHPLRRLAVALLVLVLTALILPALLGPLTSHAAPAPTVPSTSVVSTTAAEPAAEGYLPTPADPPATDSGGAWIPAPDEPPAQASSDTGGER